MCRSNIKKKSNTIHYTTNLNIYFSLLFKKKGKRYRKFGFGNDKKLRSIFSMV